MKTYKLKTPLRYPGGKSRAMKFLGDYFPKNIESYVEPFLGGGSVALWVTQQYPNANIHVNDAYHPLYAFWQQLQEQGTEMCERLMDIKKSTEHSEDAQRELFHDAQKWMHDDRIDMFTLACAFYIANKCSFSGLGTSTFSKQAYDGNFTINSINKLPEYQKLIGGWTISNLDYNYFIVNGEFNDKIAILGAKSTVLCDFRPI